MVNPKTLPRENRGAWDDFGMDTDDDDFETPPGVTRKERALQPNSPLSPVSLNKGKTPTGSGTARQSTKRLQLVDNDDDDGDWSAEEEDESEDEKPPASKGKKRKKPVSSKAKKGPSERRHSYPPVDPRYAEMTTERLFNDGHIATGRFSYSHPQFAKEMTAFNTVKVKGKPVWQQQPFGPSTLHNIIVIADHFPSLRPFLGLLEKLCKPRASTNRMFLAQRAQQYEESGRRHRDGKNGPWRMCITVHNPEAPADFKQMEVGVADASKAKGSGAVNAWQLKADGEPDSVRFECPSGSYHIMDEIGTGTISHVHHQAIIRTALIPVYGAPTTFVIDFDPVNSGTFIEDVRSIAEGTADEVKAGVDESVYVPPPTEEQIGTSCYAQKWSDWNEQQKAENLENYTQARRDSANSCNITGCSCESAEECTCVGHQHVKNASVAGAALGTGANQVGSAPSDGAAGKMRKPIPGQLNPVRAHGFCFGFGADGVGLPQKLYDKFAGEHGFEDGVITEGGCEIPNFSEAGVTKGKSTWQLDEHDNLILPVHSSKETEGHPRCQLGGCVPVEKVNESWRLCHWALKYILARRIVQRISQSQRHNGAPAKSRAKGRKE